MLVQTDQSAPTEDMVFRGGSHHLGPGATEKSQMLMNTIASQAAVHNGRLGSFVGMERELRGVAVWFTVAGVLTLIREFVGLADPAYYAPVTALDYSAAWLTSIAGGVAAVALFMWWRRSPVRRGSWLLLIAALAFATSAIGNLLGDVFDLEIGEQLWTAGGVAVVGLLLAGVAALTVRDPYRWSGFS